MFVWFRVCFGLFAKNNSQSRDASWCACVCVYACSAPAEGCFEDDKEFHQFSCRGGTRITDVNLYFIYGSSHRDLEGKFAWSTHLKVRLKCHVDVYLGRQKHKQHRCMMRDLPKWMLMKCETLTSVTLEMELKKIIRHFSLKVCIFLLRLRRIKI